MNYAHYRRLDIAVADGVLTMTLNRPGSANAIDELMHRELSRVFYDITLDEQVKVVILTGAGSSFCAGGDISWMKALLDPAAFERTAIEGKRIVLGMLECPMPIIAKVNGAAMGLGATIALFSDIIIAADTAKFADPHVRVGLAAGDGGAVIWPQLVGFARAKEFLMTGNAILAPEADRIGLINYAVPASELDDKVQALSNQICSGATKAISWTKAAVNVALKQLAGTILETSFVLEALSNLTEDHRRAIEAFAEKRLVTFAGR